jgi:hypothetical protein
MAALVLRLRAAGLLARPAVGRARRLALSPAPGLAVEERDVVRWLDWSAHLAHWYDGERRWGGRQDTPGPVVQERGYLRETCPHCGAVAVRPVDMPRDIRVFPPGHEVRRDRRGRVVGDVCPELTSRD